MFENWNVNEACKLSADTVIGKISPETHFSIEFFSLKQNRRHKNDLFIS